MTKEVAYTEQDLRTEAARYIGAEWDSLEINAAMAERDPWRGLSGEAFEEAFGRVLDLATDAADLSRWVIDAGADGLSPSDQYVEILAEGRVAVRMHLAFTSEMPPEVRQQVTAALNQNVGGEVMDDSDEITVIEQITISTREAS